MTGGFSWDSREITVYVYLQTGYSKSKLVNYLNIKKIKQPKIIRLGHFRIS
jgi:hypothetical protein